MLVLGIETSCDETGVALYDTQRGLLADALHSQASLHDRYGGVVPELASRDHIRKIAPLIADLLDTAGLRPEHIDAVAFTAGPGLVGALLVGAAFGRSFAYGLGVPALGVHHMEAHLLAPLIAQPDLEPPFLALLVSGGHSQLMRVDGLGRYALLGESVDDAAGEAFDKAAKMLGLGYPGGPAISRAAEDGDPARFRFPRPMTDRPGLDMSFSGLKTFARNTIAQLAQSSQLAQPPQPGQPAALGAADTADIARAFEEAVVDTLAIKCARAAAATGLDTLVAAGGVAANKRLRARLAQALPCVVYPPPRLCTDNGAMIAYAGALRLASGERSPLAVQARPRWPMAELAPPVSA